MKNFLVCCLVLLMVTLPITVSSQDKVKDELQSAKEKYLVEKAAYRTGILEAFDRREASARSAADKKLIDQIKMEREAFETWNAIPANVPSALGKRRASSRTHLENAFTSAIKASIRAKNDDAAAALEKELQEFRGDSWPHLNLESATVKGDFFQIGKLSSVFTSEEFSGPIEINVSARTEKENIRIRAGRGASVIFNWEVNPGQLRVSRPDGNDQVESGSLSTANVTPLKPGVWYKLRWRITEQGMQVFVNDQIVFDEMRTYDLATRSKVSIRAERSLVDVRDFYVVRLAQP